MKTNILKSVTTLLLFCFGAMHFYAQNSTLTINVGDRCDLPIDAKVNTKLYYHNGANTVLLKESNTNPAVFSNLVASFEYSIETIIEDPISYNFTIKDIVLIQRHVLGLSQLNPIAQKAADVNIDGKITASDMAELTKSLLGVSSFTSKKYYLHHETLPINVKAHSTSIYHFDGILNGDQTLNLYAGRTGNVAHAMSDYCNGICNDITNRSANILYDDLLVEKDKEISLPIYINSADRYLALDFTMNIKNATIVDIKTENGTIHKIDNNGNIKAIVSYSFPNHSDTAKVIYTLVLKPDINGKVSEILFLQKENTVNEAIVELDGCIVSVKNMSLKQNGPAIENCVLYWPESIKIKNCDDLTGVPEINPLCKTYYHFFYTDQKFGECFKTIRTWTGLHWLQGTLETYIQVITVQEDLTHQCSKNYSINLKDGFKFVSARSLAIDPNPSHIYSFSSTDIGDSVRLFQYVAPFIEEYKIYDNTDDVFCIARIEKTLVDPTSLIVLNKIEVRYNNGFKVLASKFTPNSILPTGISDLRISFDGGAYLPSMDFDQSYEGQDVTFKLKYKVNGQDYIYGEVTAYLKPKTILDDVDPLRLFAYNDYLIAGQPYVMEFYSSNFTGILSFQFGMKVDKIKLSSAEDGKLQIKSAYSYFPSRNEIRIVWYDPAAIGKTLGVDDVLFKFTFVPEISGFLKDFISIDPTIMDPLADFSDLNVSGTILLDIDFPNRITSSVDDVTTKKFAVYPNPVYSDNLSIEWKSDEFPLRISVLDIHGRKLLDNEVKESPGGIIQLPIYNISRGKYILLIQTDRAIYAEKVVVFR